MSIEGKTLFVATTAEPNPKLPGTIHSAAKDIEDAGGKALPLQVDLRDEGAVVFVYSR